MDAPSDNFCYHYRCGATLYYIVTNKASGGVLIDPKGIVVYTPPYYRYLRGKHVEEVRKLAKSLHAIYEGNGVT